MNDKSRISPARKKAPGRLSESPRARARLPRIESDTRRFLRARAAVISAITELYSPARAAAAGFFPLSTGYSPRGGVGGSLTKSQVRISYWACRREREDFLLGAHRNLFANWDTNGDFPLPLLWVKFTKAGRGVGARILWAGRGKIALRWRFLRGENGLCLLLGVVFHERARLEVHASHLGFLILGFENIDWVAIYSYSICSS